MYWCPASVTKSWELGPSSQGQPCPFFPTSPFSKQNPWFTMSHICIGNTAGTNCGCSPSSYGAPLCVNPGKLLQELHHTTPRHLLRKETTCWERERKIQQAGGKPEATVSQSLVPNTCIKSPGMLLRGAQSWALPRGVRLELEVARIRL